jgi:hypothetical protein
MQVYYKMESTLDESYLGYFKYDGQLVEAGYLDARKSAEVLIGIDEVLRHFLYQEDKTFQETVIELPVRIRKGSWEALIPKSLTDWLITGGGIALTKYASTAVTEIAKNDFKDKGTKDILKEAFKSIKWVIKIATHLKSLVVKAFGEVTFVERAGQSLIGIQNEKGEWIYAPKKYLEAYRNCPEKLFEKLAHIIEPERELEIGVNDALPLDKDEEFKAVKIKSSEKFIFYKNEDVEEIVFPELLHGNYVELYGHVTRGNENTNNIGFEYLNHILVCSPVNGNVKDYKNLMFTNCIIKGYVDRLSDDGTINERKPRIRFITLEEIPSQSNQGVLFK